MNEILVNVDFKLLAKLLINLRHIFVLFHILGISIIKLALIVDDNFPSAVSKVSVIHMFRPMEVE